MLNERKQEIIKLIHNQSLDLDEIANILNVSSRTVRRDLINIVETVQEMGYQVEKNKTVYKIIDDDYTLFEQINSKGNNNLNTEERIVVAMSSVVDGANEINIEDVANQMFVTPTSVKSLITNFLDNYNVSYKAKGIKVALDIDHVIRRELIVALLRDYIRTTDINAIILEATLDTTKVRNNQIVRNYIEFELFERLFIEIENIFNDSNKYVTDFQLVMLVVTICVSSKQCKTNKLESNDTNVISNKIIDQIVMASEIVDKNEINYLVTKLDSIITELEYEKVNLALISEISEAIVEVENKLGVEFSNKRKLEYQICTHNARVVNINNDTHLTTNVSLTNFVSENKYLFEIIKSVEGLYKDDLDNLKYLLIYFVMALEDTLTSREWQIYVICFGGMGTSLMIKKQLEKEFPNSMIQNLSYARALSGATANADLIVSNSKLPNNLQNIVVGHVISKDNLKEINSILLHKSSKAMGLRQTEKIICNVGYQVKSSNYQTATQVVLENYQLQGSLSNAQYIYEKLKKREQVGIGLPDSPIAFFHTRSSSINNLSITTYNTDQFETIGFDGQPMICNKVLLVLVPVDISDNLLDKVNILSYSLISDEQLIEAIINDNLEKIKQVLN